MLLQYDNDQGGYPSDLGKLSENDYLDAPALDQLTHVRINGVRKPLTYIPGKSSSGPGETIVLHTPAPIDGIYIFLSLDGSVKSRPESEFLEILGKQSIK